MVQWTFATLAVLLCLGAGQDVEKFYRGMTGGPQEGQQVELPGGRWTDHAQDVLYDGNRLCARLRKEDDSWAKSCIFVEGTQVFKAVDGRFELDDPDPAILKAYVDIGYSPDFPPGTWRESARNYKFSGSTLTAELRRDDGSWVPAAATVTDWHFLQNNDGQFYVQKASCASMGTCAYSWLMKADSQNIMCASAICDQTRDRETCCNQVQSCAFMTSCGTRLVPDLEGFCRGLICDQVTDKDICCVPAAYCDSLTCVYGYVLKPDPNSLVCPNSICFPDGDRDLCCDPRAECWTLGLSHGDCYHGEYFKDDQLCANKTCNVANDLRTCCKPAMDCESGLNCSYGFTQKPNSSDIYCPGPECNPDWDEPVCCDALAPCSDIACGNGYYQEENMFCQDVTCKRGRDFDDCCFRSASCSTFESHVCPYGYWFDTDEWCLGPECDEYLGDRSKCCKVAEPCTGLTCPHGYIYKVNYLSYTCKGDQCSLRFAENVDRCCDAAAHCDTLPCPHGYTPDPAANDTYCAGTSCLESRDRDLCCAEAPSCVEAYNCPHGFTSWPGTYCDGVTCDVERDRDICCRPAMPCTVLTCPLNWVLRPDTYCDGITCVESRDLYWCCERGMALQYYRFAPVELREPANPVVQAMGIEFFNQGVLIDFMDEEQPSIAFCNPCDVPWNGKEGPDRLIDMNFNTKWLDYTNNPVYITLPFIQPIFTYRFQTGDDAPERDPWLWKLEGSPDQQEWVVLHEMVDRNHNDVPIERKTWTGIFTIGVPCYAPMSMFVPDSPNITCDEGDIIRHDYNCTTLCNEGFTPSVSKLHCLKGELTPSGFTCN